MALLAAHDSRVDVDFRTASSCDGRQRDEPAEAKELEAVQDLPMGACAVLLRHCDVALTLFVVLLLAEPGQADREALHAELRDRSVVVRANGS